MTRARDKAVLSPSPTGKQTIWVPASAMQPTTTIGCDPLTTVESGSPYRPEIVSLNFPDGGVTAAQFSVAFPKSWDAGTLTFKVYWSADSTSTNSACWSFQGAAVNDNITISQIYPTLIYNPDTHCGDALKLNISSESAAVTVGGDTIADDSLIYFRLLRSTTLTTDTLAAACRLHGIKLFFTTDAGNDE